MMETTVVHVNEPHDVYIGRVNPRRRLPASPFANPYVIGVHGTREQVIALYRTWIQTQPHLLAMLPELRGKRLGCWCAPMPCHGDVLAELADALTLEETNAAD